jgi:hypothetical protein
MEDRRSPVKINRPSKDYWTTIAVGRSQFALIAWNGMRDDRSGLSLQIAGPQAKPHFYALRDRWKTEIDSKLGPVEWRELPNAKESQIALTRPGKPSDRSTWPELDKWMAEQAERWVEVLRPIVRSLEPDIPETPVAASPDSSGAQPFEESPTTSQ